MTWTCKKCQNVNPVSECTCLRPNCSGTPFKPVDRPAGLSEEERAAWEAYREGHKRAFPPSYKLCPFDEANGVVKMLALDIYRAARAPLEAELTKLRAAIKELERQRDNHQKASGAAAERAERAEERVRELESAREEDRRHMEFLNGEYWSAVARCNNWKEFVGKLVEFDQDECAKMCDDFVRESVLKRVAELKATELRGQVDNTKHLVNALGKARDLDVRVKELEAQLAQAQKPAAKSLADMIAESTTLAMGQRTAAIETMIREFMAQTGAKVEDCVLVEQMEGAGLTWHIEHRPKSAAPAGLPEINAPMEVLCHGAWLTGNVVDHGDEPGSFWVQVLREGKVIASVLRNMSEKDKLWRLPPAQTSREPAERWERFNDTAGALYGGNVHRDRCKCQGDDQTPHKHYPNGKHSCMRCGCSEYSPQLPGEPAAHPPGEVSTSIDNVKAAVNNQLYLKVCVSHLRPAIDADIRANLERETAKDKARIAELTSALAEREERIENFRRYSVGQEQRIGKKDKTIQTLRLTIDENLKDNKKLSTQIGSLKSEVLSREVQRDAALAEVERLKGELARSKTVEGAMSVLTVNGWEAGVKITQLFPEKAPKRCPADGMDDDALGEKIWEAMLDPGRKDPFDRVGQFRASGAKARELFTPSEDAKPQGGNEGGR